MMHYFVSIHHMFFYWFANLKHHFELIELIQPILFLCETVFWLLFIIICVMLVYACKRPFLCQYGLGVEQEFGRCRTFNCFYIVNLLLLVQPESFYTILPCFEVEHLMLLGGYDM